MTEAMENGSISFIELLVEEKHSSDYLEQAVSSLGNLARHQITPEKKGWALLDVRTRVRRRWNLQNVELRASYYVSYICLHL